MAKFETLAKQAGQATGKPLKDEETNPPNSEKRKAGRPPVEKQKETTIHVRFDEASVNKMKKHFESLGLSLSAGVRMQMMKYIKEHRL